MRSPEELKIALGTGAAVTALVYPAEAPTRNAALILAHGAGAGQRSPFLVSFALALSARGLDVITFNFPYIEERRRVPDRRPVLEACYDAIVAKVYRSVPSARDALFVGGKSMGGRMATHLAAANPTLPVMGLVLLGYPLHPPGRPTERRDAHLADVRRPMLIVQGSRDTFGTPAEFASLLPRLSPEPRMYVVDRGDHSFKIGRGGKPAQERVYESVQQAIVEWIEEIKRSAPETRQRPD